MPRDPRGGTGTRRRGGSTSRRARRGRSCLGRTEYAVRSVDASTGRERWNLTYAELRPIAKPEEMIRAVATGGGDSAPSAGRRGPFADGPRAVDDAGTARRVRRSTLAERGPIARRNRRVVHGPSVVRANLVRAPGRVRPNRLQYSTRRRSASSSTTRRWTTNDDDLRVGACREGGAVRAPPRRRVLARPRRARRRPRPRRRATCEAERRRHLEHWSCVPERALHRTPATGRGTRTTPDLAPREGLLCARGSGIRGSRPSSGTPTPRVSRRRRRPLRAPPPDRSPSRSSRPRRRSRPPQSAGARDRAGSGFPGVSKKLFRVTSPGGEAPTRRRSRGTRPRRGRGGEALAAGDAAAAGGSRRRRGTRGGPGGGGGGAPAVAPQRKAAPRARGRAGAAGARSGVSRRRTATLPVPSRARRVRVRRGWGGCRCTSPRRSGTVRAGRSCSPGARRSPRPPVKRLLAQFHELARAPSSPRSSPRTNTRTSSGVSPWRRTPISCTSRWSGAKKRSRGASRRTPPRGGRGVTKKTMTETKTETKTARANGRYRSLLPPAGRRSWIPRRASPRRSGRGSCATCSRGRTRFTRGASRTGT